MTGSGCDAFRNDVDHIVPYVDRPEEIRLGTPNYYATVCTGCSAGCGVLVTSRGGRPVKLEGNPQHPVNRGGVCALGHSMLQELYNPDRFLSPRRRSGQDWSRSCPDGPRSTIDRDAGPTPGR